MATCDNCGTLILFGGIRQGEYRFCGKKCHEKGLVFRVADRIPLEIVQEEVEALHQGSCPTCGGPGPVDVHTSHVVWSALLLTSFRSRSNLCCRSCGIKAQLGATLVSGAFGWWGVPWGILMTPVQLVRNLHGIVFGPDPGMPSAGLESIVRRVVACRIMNGKSVKADETELTRPDEEREFLVRAAS